MSGQNRNRVCGRPTRRTLEFDRVDGLEHGAVSAPSQLGIFGEKLLSHPGYRGPDRRLCRIRPGTAGAGLRSLYARQSENQLHVQPLGRWFAI